MKTDLTFLRPLVAKVMTTPLAHQAWTVQGFGFLRTYFGPPDHPKKFRLNLWDSRFTVPEVSTIHDHPWDFKSVIVAGQFVNQRYTMAELPVQSGPVNYTHHFTTLRTGEGGGLVKDEMNACILVPHRPELYAPGEVYEQDADEIHETLYKDGTVTLNERTGDTEHARVFWSFGNRWVDAMPRPAERHEVFEAVERSFREWFR